MEKYNSLSCLSDEQLLEALKQAEMISLHSEFLHLLLDEIKKRDLSVDRKQCN